MATKLPATCHSKEGFREWVPRRDPPPRSKCLVGVGGPHVEPRWEIVPKLWAMRNWRDVTVYQLTEAFRTLHEIPPTLIRCRRWCVSVPRWPDVTHSQFSNHQSFIYGRRRITALSYWDTLSLSHTHTLVQLMIGSFSVLLVVGGNWFWKDAQLRGKLPQVLATSYFNNNWPLRFFVGPDGNGHPREADFEVPFRAVGGRDTRWRRDFCALPRNPRRKRDKAIARAVSPRTISYEF